MIEQYLIEIPGYNPDDEEVQWRYFSTGGYATKPTDTPANTYYEPRVKQPGNVQIDLFEPGKTSGGSRVGFGEVVLLNGDGSLDYLLDWGLGGRTMNIKKLTAAGALVLLAACAMEQPTPNTGEISIRIRDPQAVLSQPIQPTKYAGDNVLPAGIEGTDDIKGKPKPLTFGRCLNVTPVCVNTSRLIYQVHTATVDIAAAYDKGVSLTKGADYASQADMEATPPDPATYRAWPAGGCFRLGSSPIGQLTCDVTEGATAADRAAAQVAKRIGLRVLDAANISAADVTALDADNDAEVGIYISDEMFILPALDQVLGSVGAWSAIDADNVLRTARLEAPSGSPDISLAGAEITTLDSMASSGQIPAYKVNLNYQRNWTVQTDLAGSVVPLYSWESPTFPSSRSLSGKVAFGNGMFVMVEYGTNKAHSSPDGITWTERTLPATANWQAVVYGAGKFVAVPYGATNTIAATSPDGITWTQQTMPTSAYLRDLAYGEGIFVATQGGVGKGNKVYTSPDGVTWTERSLPTAVGDYVICYGGGTFVVAAYGTNVAASSPDGINWTAQTLPATANWQAFTYGNGQFVLFDKNVYVATSPDGATWTNHTLELSNLWAGAAYGDGLFVASAYQFGAPAVVLQSADGLSWTANSAPNFGDGVNALAFGNGRFVGVSVGSGGSRPVVYSPYATEGSRGWKMTAFRTSGAVDSSVLTTHPLAPELNFDTLLLDATEAGTEATRRLGLYDVRRDTLTVTFSAQNLSGLHVLGKVAKITYPRYGCDSGKLFVVLGVSVDWALNRATLILWG